MFDDPPPFRRHAISVSGGHMRRDQESGSEAAILALVFQDRPGPEYSPVLRRIVDPQRQRIFCIDPRGAGYRTRHACWTLPCSA
ncbi:MAG: hypothetical protein ACHP83_13060 [Burkholderiales bacterium]